MLLAHGAEGPPTISRLLTDVEWEPTVGLPSLVALAAYLWGVRLLAERGDHWPVGRTVAMLLGTALLWIATMSGVAAYDVSLFSAHAVQHLLLQMLAPIPLALSAPVTLALRVLPRRPRGVLLSAVHSRVAKVLTFPLVPYALFIASPFALYYTDLYEATLRSELLHELSHLHFVAVGLLFYVPVLGIDPIARRWPFPARLLLVFLVLPVHVILGISVMMSEYVIAGDFYAALPQPWLPDPLEDQRMGGGILWIFGDIVGLAMIFPLLLQWSRSEEREAARTDRRLDRASPGAERTVPWWVSEQAQREGAPPTT